MVYRTSAAKLIQKKLAEHRWQQKDLHEKTGVSQSMISRVLGGTAYLSLDIAKQFAAALGIDERLLAFMAFNENYMQRAKEDWGAEYPELRRFIEKCQHLLDKLIVEPAAGTGSNSADVEDYGLDFQKNIRDGDQRAMKSGCCTSCQEREMVA